MRIGPDIQPLAERLRPILRRHGVVRAGLFGSVARGEAGPQSDLDLLVEFGRQTSLLDRAGLKLELEAALGRAVDVVHYRSLYEPIRERMLAEELPIL
ncbi:MAG: nucleotidyltransferase family protein [Desulfarculus sp.]|nr:nucleotidyltransferase family protein [Desulfarculus sp.]